MSKRYKNIAAGLALFVSFSAGLAAFSDHILGFLKNSVEITDLFYEKNKPVPFVIKSNVPDFAVLGTVTGQFLVDGPFLKINLDTIVLRGKQPEHVESIRVGVASYTNKEGSWGIRSWGEYKTIGKDLAETETTTIGAYSAVIAIDQLVNIKKHWLVLEIRLRDEESGYATTYAHSNKDVLGGVSA